MGDPKSRYDIFIGSVSLAKLLRGRQFVFEFALFWGLPLLLFLGSVRNRIYCFNAIFCRCRAQKLAICLEISALSSVPRCSPPAAPCHRICVLCSPFSMLNENQFHLPRSRSRYSQKVQRQAQHERIGARKWGGRWRRRRRHPHLSVPVIGEPEAGVVQAAVPQGNASRRRRERRTSGRSWDSRIFRPVQRQGGKLIDPNEHSQSHNHYAKAEITLGEID